MYYSRYDQIEEFIKNNPGATSASISDGLNLGKQTVRKYLREMIIIKKVNIKVSFIKKKKSGRADYTYTIVNEGAQSW